MPDPTKSELVLKIVNGNFRQVQSYLCPNSDKTMFQGALYQWLSLETKGQQVITNWARTSLDEHENLNWLPVWLLPTDFSENTIRPRNNLYICPYCKFHENRQAVFESSSPQAKFTFFFIF